MEERFEIFTVLMAKIRRNVQRVKTEEMAEYNLKSPQVSCLYNLYKHDSLTATELCELCGEDKAAISRSVVQLEKEGYVRYDDAAKKHYKSNIFLTESGKKVACEVVKKIDGYIDLVGSGLSERERLIFYKSLYTISNNLEKICQAYDSKKD